MVRRSGRWLAGFAALLAGLGLQVIALTLAPVAVVQPVLVGGLVVLVILGGPVLGERLGWRPRAALVLILAAVAAIAVSAGGGGRVARSVSGPAFLVLALPLAGLGLAASSRAVRGAAQARERPRAVVLVAFGAGLLYGLGAVAEKAVAAKLVGHGLVAGTALALASPYPWVFAAATAAGMVVFQVGLQRHPASLMASLTNVASSLCAFLGAWAVFGELLLPPGWWSLARLAGFAAVLAATAILASERPVSSEAAVG